MYTFKIVGFSKNKTIKVIVLCRALCGKRNYPYFNAYFYNCYDSNIAHDCATY